MLPLFQNTLALTSISNSPLPPFCLLFQLPTPLLSVAAPLELSEGLSDLSVEVGDEASLSCRASGVPVPMFRWLLDGTELSEGITSTNETRGRTVDVESTLVLSGVTEGHTGVVTCVAYHQQSGQVLMATSTANLVVLSE